jgi:putative ribosome biogenesis GTPase RsgA
MSQTVPIDLQVLQSKIVEGITAIQSNVTEKAAVLFLGDTGVGKSALVSYLIGESLKVEEVGLKTCLTSSASPQCSPLHIGHTKYSETSLPIKVKCQGFIIYDCPGFNGNSSL